MAVQGPFKVVCEEVFPHGLGVVSSVTPMADFDASTRENRVQARDRDTGLPVWVVEVMDFDPDARERTFKVKIAADSAPAVPPLIPGTPVRPVVLQGLTVTPYLKETGNDRQKVAYSLRASGMAAPRPRASDKAA